MSYGMHDYLAEKAMKNCGMRKEASAVGSALKAAGRGIATGAKWVGDKLARGGKAVWNQGDALSERMWNPMSPETIGSRLGSWVSRNPRKARAAILGLEGAGVAGVGTGSYVNGKALLNKDQVENSPLNKALELLKQYKGTATGVTAAAPAALIAAGVSKENKLRNALITAAITSLALGGAGYAYDRYNK